MSGDNGAILQAKLREEKEAKRATMDGRHEYILSTVSERLGMSIEDVEEFMLEGSQVGWSTVCTGGEGLTDVSLFSVQLLVLHECNKDQQRHMRHCLSTYMRTTAPHLLCSFLFTVHCVVIPLSYEYQFSRQIHSTGYLISWCSEIHYCDTLFLFLNSILYTRITFDPSLPSSRSLSHSSPLGGGQC